MCGTYLVGLRNVPRVRASNRYQPLASNVIVPGTFGVDPLAGEWRFQYVYDDAGHTTIIRTPTA